MSSGEKASHEKNVPKIFRAATWSAAVISAGTFAFVVGVFAYNYLQSPISASTNTQQTSCSAGTLQYAVNNYPGTTAIPVTNHADYYKKMGVDSKSAWRCSLLCITVPDPTKGKELSNANITAARNYITKNCDFSIVNNKKEFDNLSGPVMLNTIILDSLKPDCQGPNSQNYGRDFYCKSDDGKENPALLRSDTSYVTPTPTPTPAPTPTPTKTPAKVQAPSSSGNANSAQPATENWKAPATANTSSKANSANLNNLKKCWDKLRNVLNEYGFKNSEIATPFLQTHGFARDINNLFTNYYTKLSNSKTWGNNEEKIAKSGYNLCNKIYKKLSAELEKEFPSNTKLKNEGTQIIAEIQISGKLYYSPRILSKGGKVCASLVPKQSSGPSKGTTYNSCTTSNNGQFYTKLRIKQSDLSQFNSVMIYMVDTGRILGFIGKPHNAMYTFSINKDSYGSKDLGNVVLNQQIVVNGATGNENLTAEQLKNLATSSTGVDCLTGTRAK